MDLILAGFEFGCKFTLLFLGAILGVTAIMLLIALVIKHWIIALCALIVLVAIKILPYIF